MASDEQPNITCPVCEMTSYHPTDVKTGYCGNCEGFTAWPPGCVSAYLRSIGETDDTDRVARLVVAWVKERPRGSRRIMDWLPANYDR